MLMVVHLDKQRGVQQGQSNPEALDGGRSDMYADIRAWNS
jgi:hypothetical protein